MSYPSLIYCVQFANDGKKYRLYAKEIAQSHLFGFIEISNFVFGIQNKLLVDPEEEKLKNEFSGIMKTYVPIQSIIRIDAVTVDNDTQLSDIIGGNITNFPSSSRSNPI